MAVLACAVALGCSSEDGGSDGPELIDPPAQAQDGADGATAGDTDPTQAPGETGGTAGNEAPAGQDPVTPGEDG